MSAPSPAVGRVLAKLPVARRSGGEWRAPCPAHDDHDDSLTIQEGDDGRALVYCHATCTQQEVVASLGLTMRDLFVARRGTQWSRRRTVVATYDYADALGDVRFRVVRTEPKGFRMEVPDGRGGWRSGRDCMNGIQRLLYRLPAVCAAVGTGEPVYITEGEKDANLLAAEGVCATTIPGGAGKWRRVPDAPVVLAGAEVVVVADRDRAGLLHAAEVAESLNAVGCVVRVVAAVVGKDTADHLAGGYGVGDLVEVDPAEELAALPVDPKPERRSTFAMPPEEIRHCGCDGCVVLYTHIDGMPGRTASGRNHIAELLDWKRSAKVTEHANHLEAGGWITVEKRPSGGGHKATLYTIAYNPARTGAISRRSQDLPKMGPSGALASHCPPVDGGGTALADDRGVGRQRPTSSITVRRERSTAMLSTSGVSRAGADKEGQQGRLDSQDDEAVADVPDAVLDRAPYDPVPPEVRFSWADGDLSDTAIETGISEQVRAVGGGDEWDGQPWTI